MIELLKHCPFTSYAFKALIEQKNKNYYVIKSGEFFLYKDLKHGVNYGRKALVLLAMGITLVASPALLLLDLTGRALSKKGIDIFKKLYKKDFHYLFCSTISTSHTAQLKRYVTSLLATCPELNTAKNTTQYKSPFQKEAADLFTLILNTDQLPDESSRRNFHQTVLEKLRHLISQKEHVSKENHAYDLEAISALESLSEWLYIGSNLMPEISSFIAEQLPAEANAELEKTSSSETPNFINRWHNKLNLLPKFNGLDDLGRLYDPHHLGDLPTFLFNYSLKDKQIKMIRTPAITRDIARNSKGEISQVQIVEEFRSFLDSYKKQGKVHLYVNLMERAKTSEGTRTRTIEALEKEYPDTLHVISLSKNSPFYTQMNEHQAIDDPATFKTNFLRELSKEQNSYFYFSPALNNVQWQEKCREILDNVHRTKFNNATHLTREQRLDFIEVAYTEIIEAAMEILKPDSCNISCKSCIDRGAALLAEQFVKHCRNSSKELTGDQRKQFVAIALAPAILSQNRVMQPKFNARMHTATQLILNSPTSIPNTSTEHA